MKTDLNVQKAQALAAYKEAKAAWQATLTPQTIKDRSAFRNQEWRGVKEAEAACRRLGVRI